MVCVGLLRLLFAYVAVLAVRRQTELESAFASRVRWGCMDDCLETHKPGVDESANGVPLCDQCLSVCDPLEHFCQVCGRAVGLFTPYMPLEGIAYDAQGCGRLYDRACSKTRPLWCRVVDWFVIFIFVHLALWVAILSWFTRRLEWMMIIFRGPRGGGGAG